MFGLKEMLRNFMTPVIDSRISCRTLPEFKERVKLKNCKSVKIGHQIEEVCVFHRPRGRALTEDCIEYVDNYSITYTAQSGKRKIIYIEPMRNWLGEINLLETRMLFTEMERKKKLSKELEGLQVFCSWDLMTDNERIEQQHLKDKNNLQPFEGRDLL